MFHSLKSNQTFDCEIKCTILNLFEGPKLSSLVSLQIQVVHLSEERIFTLCERTKCAFPVETTSKQKLTAQDFNV